MKNKENKEHLDVLMYYDDETKQLEEKGMIGHFKEDHEQATIKNMYYSIDVGKKIEQYKVKIDTKKLNKIKEEVIENNQSFDNLNIYNIVHKLLHGYESAISDIYEYDKKLQEDDKNIDKKIEKFDKTYKEFKPNNQKEYHEALITSDGLWFKKNKINNDKKYLKKIKNLLSFELVKTISKKEVKEVCEFLNMGEPTFGKKKIKTKIIDKHSKK